ncbi:MAG: aminotransferase class V-fold PLP-dependent enzyme, partial [Lachnospiraceae bacterium]|nr:aminotransferase class V-fold PLP-dependent enzyme [Lachnospiraceae bacterium]
MNIYADNAATTKMSENAINTMLFHMKEVYGNPSSLYGVGQKAKEALEDARRRASAVLNCEPREIYFTSGGSEADNQAIISAARFNAAKGKKHIISTAFEHHAVLHTLDKLKKEGFEIELLDVHSNGIVTAEQVKNAIREDTALVTIMYANNEIGTIQPISEIGAVCRESGVLFHTDAVQAIGHIPVDIQKDNIDMLSLSAHK